ncbi:helix-turn-helix domain-containing protein, partial [Syntrophomonas zehnderi]
MIELEIKTALIIAEEEEMNVAEGWNMYLDIQDLKAKHFNISQISRRLDLSRTTVYKYLDMTPEEMEQFL